MQHDAPRYHNVVEDAHLDMMRDLASRFPELLPLVGLTGQELIDALASAYASMEAEAEAIKAALESLGHESLSPIRKAKDAA